MSESAFDDFINHQLDFGEPDEPPNAVSDKYKQQMREKIVGIITEIVSKPLDHPDNQLNALQSIILETIINHVSPNEDAIRNMSVEEIMANTTFTYLTIGFLTLDRLQEPPEDIGDEEEAG